VALRRSATRTSFELSPRSLSFEERSEDSGKTPSALLVNRITIACCSGCHYCSLAVPFIVRVAVFYEPKADWAMEVRETLTARGIASMIEVRVKI